MKREGASFLFNDDDDSSIAHNMLASPIGQHVLIKLQRILENVAYGFSSMRKNDLRSVRQEVTQEQ